MNWKRGLNYWLNPGIYNNSLSLYAFIGGLIVKIDSVSLTTNGFMVKANPEVPLETSGFLIIARSDALPHSLWLLQPLLVHYV